MKMIRQIVPLAAFVLAPCFIMSAVAQAQVVDTFDSINAGWVTDRYEPDQFTTELFQGDSRLSIHIDPAQAQGNRPPAYASSFYNTQGRQMTVSVQDSFSLSADLYVDSLGWASQDISTGLWGVGKDSLSNISAYPIIAYRQGSIAASGDGFYAWDYVNGGYSFLAAATTDAWNHLEIKFAVGSGADYLVNGVALGGVADPDTVELSGIIINTSNFGEGYTVRYDDLRAVAVPEPSTYAAFGVVGLVALVVVRRRRSGRKSVSEA